MDQDRKRTQDTPGTLLKDEKNRHNAGHKTVPGGKKETQPTTTLEVKRPKLRLRVTSRRVRINPEKKRANYITRLELLWEQLDKLISDTIDERTRIKAMNTLIRCLQSAYGMVEAVEIEQIEEEIEALKKQEEEQGEPAYRIEEDQ